MRNGSCDFMVNTLDESLRVLKNELRKKKALSVGLLGEASAILPAMVERGVQPDLVADTAARPISRSTHPYQRAAACNSSSAARSVWTRKRQPLPTSADLLKWYGLQPASQICGEWTSLRWSNSRQTIQSVAGGCSMRRILPSPATFAARPWNAPRRSDTTGGGIQERNFGWRNSIACNPRAANRRWLEGIHRTAVIRTRQQG